LHRNVHTICPLSDNPETVRIREISQSCVGFAAEEHRIKTKFRMRLARVKKALRESHEWVNALAELRVDMEMRHQAELASERERELKHAEEEWIKLNAIGDENLDEDVNKEYKSMEPYQKKKTSEEEIVHDENRNTSSKESQDRQTEGDSSEAHSFMDEEMDDVSEHEKLYDADGNAITEEDLADGFRTIMEKHIKRLFKKLGVLAALANASEQRPESESESESHENEDIQPRAWQVGQTANHHHD